MLRKLCILPLSLVGCVQAPVAPNLKLPELPPKQCEHLFMKPVPQKVTLIIDGDKITADSGGELLLRGYVRARELLK